MSLHDIKEKTVAINLDKERNLRFDLNAFSILEEKYGSIDKAFEFMQSGSMKAARTLLWVGLIHEDENITEKQVGSLITLDKLSEVLEAITLAISDALPDSNKLTETKNQ